MPRFAEVCIAAVAHREGRLNVSNPLDFNGVLTAFTRAVETNDGNALGALFALDGVYDDGFYGEFSGREAIAGMLRDHFWGHAENFRWTMSNLVCDGTHGYATYLFRYTSKLPDAKGKLVVFNGMAHYVFEGGLIKRYEEIFNTGMAQAQLDFEAERIKRHLLRKAEQLRRQSS